MTKEIMREYPKKINLKDGVEIKIRKITPKDFTALMDFYSNIPRVDRLFLKTDITDKEITRKWMKKMDYKSRGYALVAEYEPEKRIVGVVDLHLSQYHWMKDNGEIRCLISSDFRRKGLGIALIYEIFSIAVRLNLYKIEVWIMESQTAAFDVFKKVGFHKEAILKNHVIDLLGKRHNIIIMTINVEAMWKNIEDLLEHYMPPRVGIH